MKTRKIWSIPIAALALVLMLAGALAATGLVQAQTPPSVPLTKNAIVGTAGGSAVVTYKVSNYTAPVNSPTSGPNQIAAVGFTEVTEMRNAEGTKVAVSDTAKTGTFSAAFTAGVSTGTGAEKFDRITLTTGSDALIAGYTYKVMVTATYDKDVTKAAVDDPDTLIFEDGRDSGTTPDTTENNDRDGQLVTNVTVKVPNLSADELVYYTQVTANTNFTPVTKGDILSGVGSQWDGMENGVSTARGFEVSNTFAANTLKVADVSTSAEKAITFELSGNKAIVKADTNTLGAVNSDNTATLSIDRGDHDIDGNDDNNALQYTLTATVRNQAPLQFDDAAGTVITLSDAVTHHYTAIIHENTAPGTGVLAFYANSRVPAVASTDTDEDIGTEDEAVTGILAGTGSDMFRVNNRNMTIEYKGAQGALSGGTVYDLTLTANGSNGVKGRAIVGKVKITVTAVDDAPTAPETLALTLNENLKDDSTDNTGLVKAGTVIHDFTGVGTDPDGQDITYAVVATSGTGNEDDGNAFEFDGNELKTKAKIGDIGRGDNPDTGDVSEDDWPLTASVGWNLPETITGIYPDQTRKINVTVSDGVPSNNQTIEVTLTLVMNQPTMAKTTDLPADVMTGKVDHDGLSATADMDGYTYAKSLSEKDAPTTLFDLDDMVSDVNSGDTITFTVTDNESYIVHDSTTNALLLTYMPQNAESGLTDIIKVTADDGFNTDSAIPSGQTDAVDVPDVTMYIAITITEIPPTPVASKFVDIMVAENSTTCTQAGVTDGCSVAAVVTGGETFTMGTGVDGGEVDYAVDSATGVITVVNAPDYEDNENPGFIVDVDDAAGDDLAVVSVRVMVTDVNEDPTITAPAADASLYVAETAEQGDPVKVMPGDNPEQNDPAAVVTATDPENADITFGKKGKGPFAVDPSTGAITVNGALDHEKSPSYTFMVTASDGANMVEQSVTVDVNNANEAPVFTSPLGTAAVTTIPEDTANSVVIFTFTAEDADENDLTFGLRQGQSQDLFEIKNAHRTAPGMFSGDLHAKAGMLDFEDATYDGRVHVEVNDPEGLNDTLLLTVNLSNVNDNSPVFDVAPDTTRDVRENMKNHVLGNYAATDADGDTVVYTLGGTHGKSFDIDSEGDLRTHESLDYDSMTPCPTGGCMVEVIASDANAASGAPAKSHTGPAKVMVTITVEPAEDSVSTVKVRKANPVPGTAMGDAMSALAGTKTTMTRISDGKVTSMERPADLPNTRGSGPMNFVETEWASWGTVLLIEVTAESPSATCAGGNRCVELTVESDSGDHTLTLQAFRSASQENKFLAAVELVERSENSTSSTSPVYMHTDGTVAKLKTDEEDEIEVRYGNLRSSIDVENEAPEIDNFAPSHEMAFDDADVDYTFTVTDGNSGLPEPEELPDNDGDSNYTPVVALISQGQCQAIDDGAAVPAGMSKAAKINEDDTLYCPGMMQEGEYVASNGGQFGFAPIRDDKDFDDIDDGYDVETTIVLTENNAYFVTFIVCDNAGNCAYHDPKSNDDKKELAQIIVDTVAPNFVEARTGLVWDASGNEYDTDRTYIQVIFDELTQVNPATVEIDDFVVEGHSVKAVHVFENPDDDDVDWADSGRYADGARKNLRQRGSSDYGDNWYQDIENSVFLELEDELLADETPEVTIVPNGVEDGAGNEQDGDGKNADGDDADDWISPKFVIVSIVSPRETSQSQILAGDGDEVVITVTSDERLDSTKPSVSVNYVNAANGTVDTKGTATCTNADGTDGKRKRGEIVNSGTCMDSAAAIRGQSLNTSIDKVSNTEWVVTITEPKSTGYYNFYVSGRDRSSQENTGSEGVKPASVVKSFFDADGDVNVDDAVFFEGDINLPKPNVRVSGDSVTDNEANVEFRSPLFVELDFTKNHATAADCDGQDTKYMKANCVNENSEYAKDNFDDVTITMFELDGVDMTEMVKTTDNQTFLVAIEGIALGDHTAKVQAVDQAGNVLEDTLEIDFEVDDRDPFEKRLSPGWNLVSLPGEPADSSIASVLGSGVEVRTVYTYDPVVPGGWMVAVRETLDSDWQGDLTEITGQRGYWVLSDAIQDWEVNIPRLAGGAAGTGTPIQPPSIPLYAGWNLVPVTDVTGEFDSDGISVGAYLNSLDDGLDLARVLGFDTIKNEWTTLNNNGMVMFGKGYWVFVREAGTLVPGK